MNRNFRLRPATLDDAELLFVWRNDPTTRAASHKGDKINWDAHIDWLEQTLQDPDRWLMIALRDDVPVGTVRADLAYGVWELSWTVAPERRGRGVGSTIVRLATEHFVGAIRAEVKVGNSASARIAEQAGLKFVGEKSGVLHFARGDLPPTDIE